MSIKVKYEPGKDLKNSYFVVSEGDQVKKVKASFIIPWDIQEKIVQGSEDVLSPEEICKQFEEKFSSISDFRSYVKVAKRQNFSKKLAKIKNESSKDFEKKAETIQSVQDESALDKKQPAETVVSVKDESKLDDKQPTSKGRSAVKVKKYYNRLKDTGAGVEPEKAINLQSSLKKMEEELNKVKAELENKEKEIEAFKEKEKATQDSQLIASVIFDLKKAGVLGVDKDSTEKAIELIAKMNSDSISVLKSLITLFRKEENTSKTAAVKKEDVKNVPQIVMKDISTEMSKIEELSELMEEDSQI